MIKMALKSYKMPIQSKSDFTKKQKQVQIRRGLECARRGSLTAPTGSCWLVALSDIYFRTVPIKSTLTNGGHPTGHHCIHNSIPLRFLPSQSFFQIFVWLYFLVSLLHHVCTRAIILHIIYVGFFLNSRWIPSPKQRLPLIVWRTRVRTVFHWAPSPHTCVLESCWIPWSGVQVTLLFWVQILLRV